MVDGVGSDNPSVSTVRGTLVRRGGTRRPAIEVPGDGPVALPLGEIVRLVIDGREHRAPVAGRDRAPIIAGAYDNARLARERDGVDRLAEWASAREIAFGRSVLVDEVVSGDVYGLRPPGETTVYAVDRGPDRSLQHIAEGLESRGRPPESDRDGGV